MFYYIFSSTLILQNELKLPHRRRQHLHTQIPTPGCFFLSPLQKLQEEFMFWSTGQGSQENQGNGGGLQNKQTCHCLDKNAATRGEREGCALDWEKHLSPLS
uniref:Uncharacterized protein n=1 Tax=Stegastes partitus TaxID=144197 RepID=A0A3B4ZPK6_9TELE